MQNNPPQPGGQQQQEQPPPPPPQQFAQPPPPPGPAPPQVQYIQAPKQPGTAGPPPPPPVMTVVQSPTSLMQQPQISTQFSGQAASGGEDPRNLIVNYIPTPVTDNELRQLFEQYGELESARVICDRVTAHPKGYGFVKYKDEAGAKAAMENMNGFEIYNKRLKVTTAKGPHNATINVHTQRLQSVVANAVQQAVLVAQPGMQPMVVPAGAPGQPMPPQQVVQQVVQQPQGPQPPQQGAAQPAPAQTVQYVFVDSKTMQPIGQQQMQQGPGAQQPPRPMAGAVMLPGGAPALPNIQNMQPPPPQQPQQQQQPPQQQPPQQQQLPNMFQAPTVTINQSNDPMNRDSCQFNLGSQYSSFNSTPGISSQGVMSASQLPPGVPPPPPVSGGITPPQQ